MSQRKQISLPDDAAAILQSLTADCGIDASTVITQLLRRYHPHLRQLFAIDSNTTQLLTAPQVHSAVPVVTTPHVAVERRSESLPDTEALSKPIRTPITDF